MQLPPIGQKNYDWRGLAGSELEAARNRWQLLVEFFLSKLPVEVVRRHDTPILDVGCAFGAIQKEWKTKAYRNIHGIECVPKRAALASEYGCEVTVCDYRLLPMFDDG